MQFLAPIFAFLVFAALASIKIVREYERLVVFRLGRVLEKPKGPGVVIVIPGLEKAVRVSLRTVTMDVPAQDVITRDNVSMKVNAVVYFRVVDANRAIIEVDQFLFATSQLSQTTLRAVVGQHDMDQLLTEREKLNTELQSVLDRDTDPWGIKVVKVEIKHIDLPPNMQRAMARQAEAERERRAKVIAADGEWQASQKLGEAAQVISKDPTALQLRYLQTLNEMSSEKATTIIVPVPLDLFRPFLAREDK